MHDGVAGQVPGVDAPAWAQAVRIQSGHAVGERPDSAGVCGGGAQVLADAVDKTDEVRDVPWVAVGLGDEVGEQQSAPPVGEDVFVFEDIAAAPLDAPGEGWQRHGG